MVYKEKQGKELIDEAKKYGLAPNEWNDSSYVLSEADLQEKLRSAKRTRYARNGWIISIVVLIIGVMTFIYNNKTIETSNENIKTEINSIKTVALDDNWKQAQEPYSGQVVCTLKSSAAANFRGDYIDIEASIDEEPTIITIVDIDTDKPALVGNLGDRIELEKIDVGAQVYFFETTSFGNINVWTLFRDKNIIISTKQYDLLGSPFGLLWIGDCLSGV